MTLQGIHHITAITADAQVNLSFYSGTLGLRFVKKTVNFDDPYAYHLYYGDDRGTPGSILTFFAYPGVPRGIAGEGMIHRIAWRVADEPALDFWRRRLDDAGVRTERTDGGLRFDDPEGLALELVVSGGAEAPLVATAADVPPRHALRGFAGVRAYTGAPQASAAALAETLGFTPVETTASVGPATREAGAAAADGAAVPGASDWVAAGGGRSSAYVYDPAPRTWAYQGAGTVHHVAWATPDAEQPAWRERLLAAGLHATPIIDRTYFHSVYFREPSGVLFEIATLGPGFAVDEPFEHLGETLRLPARYEHLRPRLERELPALVDPRSRRAAA